jgi:hypothetical protein
LSANITLRTNGEMGLPITTYDMCAPRRRTVVDRRRHIARAGNGKSSRGGHADVHNSRKTVKHRSYRVLSLPLAVHSHKPDVEI